jgi:hypothetical protein
MVCRAPTSLSSINFRFPHDSVFGGLEKEPTVHDITIIQHPRQYSVELACRMKMKATKKCPGTERTPYISPFLPLSFSLSLLLFLVCLM